MVTQDAPSYPLYSNLFGRQAHELKALLGQGFTQPWLAIGLLDESGPGLQTQDRGIELVLRYQLRTAWQCGGLGDSSLRSEGQGEVGMTSCARKDKSLPRNEQKYPTRRDPCLLPSS